MTEQGTLNFEVPEQGNRRTDEHGTLNFEVPEQGNRRTDEHGTLNFEVPERYFILAPATLKTQSRKENPRTVFF